jgi:hypothetical protein
MLDDAHATVAVGEDAAVTGRIVDAHREDRRERAGASMLGEQCFQSRSAQQRYVAAEQQNVTVEFGQRATRLQSGMPAPELFGLEHAFGAVADQALHVAGIASDDDHRAARDQRLGGTQHVLDQRPAGDRVQDFRFGGAHALALSGSQDNRGERALGVLSRRGFAVGWHG